MCGNCFKLSQGTNQTQTQTQTESERFRIHSFYGTMNDTIVKTKSCFRLFPLHEQGIYFIISIGLIQKKTNRPSYFQKLDRNLMGKSVIWPKRLVVYGAEDTVVKTIEPIAGPHVSSYSKNICLYIFILKI